MHEPPASSSPPGAEADEDELVERARAGDAAAFEALFRRHRDGVFGLALRYCADPVEAEEVAVEAFASAWFGLPSFDGRSAFGTWLHAIAMNRARQRRRSDGRRRRRFVAVADPAAWERAVATTFPGTRIDLERAIAALPERARETTLLRHASGLSYAEVAGVMGVSIGTVKSQLSRAYRLLRERLSDD